MSSLVGNRTARQPMVPVKKAALKLPLGLLILATILRYLTRGCVILGRSPLLGSVLLLSVLGMVGWQALAPVWVIVAYALLGIAGAAAWRYWTPFRGFLRARWRRFWTYRYKWPAMVDFAGLNTIRTDGRQLAPALGTVRSNDTVDVVRAKMLTGQVVDDWAKVADRFCQTYGALDCRVRTVPKHPHDVELVFVTNDPLAYEIEPCEPTTALDFLPIAVTENGEWYNLPLLGNHILVVGATGSGKATVIWSAIRHLKPNILDGTCRILGLDGKGGVELAFGAPLFYKFVYGDGEEDSERYELAFAVAFEEAVAIMRRRQSVMLGRSRLHVPTVAEPLYVLIVDELLALTSYVGNSAVKKRIANALNLLLSQGRAFGISILGASQAAQKETLPSREFFTVRVLLRVIEKLQVAMVLGEEAWDHGAKADRIPRSMPGTAYVLLDGAVEATRVRFPHETDERIHDMVGRHPLSLVPALEEEVA
jgi:S-DNA-T family DNA segregation ATPase FtsK/SpoIIIE